MPSTYFLGFDPIHVIPAITGLVGRNRQNADLYKRCYDVRIDSACRVLLQSRFTKHTFSQYEIWLDEMQWKCDGPFPLTLCVPIRIII